MGWGSKRARVALRVPSRNAALYDGVQLVTDGDMEAVGTAAWSSTGAGAVLSKELDPRVNSTGIRALRVTSAAAASTFFQAALVKGRLVHAIGFLKGSLVGAGYGLRTGASIVLWATTLVYSFFSKYFRNESTNFSVRAQANQWAQGDDFVFAEVGTETIPGLKTTSDCRVNVPREDLMIGQHLPGSFRLGTLGRGVRVHPAATQLLTHSDIALFGTCTELTLTPFYDRDLHLLTETVANSQHKVARAAAATLVANTMYTLSWYGRWVLGLAGRQVRVRVTSAAATNFDHTFDLINTNAAYSYTFTTGAGDAGAAVVEFYILAGGADTYVGNTLVNLVIGQIVQLEAGPVPTPHIYTYNATASSIAPTYDSHGVENWLYYWLQSPRFDFEVRMSTFVANLNKLPIWSIAWGATPAHSDLTYQIGVGFEQNATVIPGTAAWLPQVDHVYKIRVVMEPAGDGWFWIIDETDDAVDLALTFSDRLWSAPTQNATAVLLGCDSGGTHQWNFHLVEAA